MASQGLSGRAYARHRGVAAATVQDWKAKGWLTLFGDGSIDKKASDAALAERRRTTKRRPSRLATAQQRKLAAQVSLLEAELAKLRGSVIPRDDVVTATREAFEHGAERLRSLAPELAPAVAGKAPVTALALLTDGLHARLTELSRTTYVAGKAPPAKATPKAKIAAASEQQLAARKIELQSERIEIKHALGRGDMELKGEVVLRLSELITAARSRALAMPTKVAPRLAMATTPAEAEVLIAEQLEEAIAELKIVRRPRRKP